MHKILMVEVGDEPIVPAASYRQDDGTTRVSKPKQKCYLHTGAKYPAAFQLTIQDGTSPFRPGFYFISGDCFKNGQYGPEIIWSRVNLVPLDEAVAALGKSQPKLAAAS
jgi:hypothetical protein